MLGRPGACVSCLFSVYSVHFLVGLFVSLTQTRVMGEKETLSNGAFPQLVIDLVGPAFCGRGHPWTGGLGLYKLAS